MTDFFTELELELRRAHARGPRSGAMPRRPLLLRLAVTAAAGAAVVALVMTLLAGAEPEREVAAPASAGACGVGADPPAEIAQTLGVLRRPRGGQLPPAEIEEAAVRGIDGAARLWSQHGRFARNDGERSYWVYPALVGSCESPEAGACVLAAAPYLDVPACAGLERIAGEGMLLFSVPLDGGRWRTSALVADGAEPAIVVGGRRVSGTVEGNLFVAEYAASHADQERSRLTVGGQSLHSPDTDPGAAG